MLAHALRALAEDGYRVTLNERGDGLRVGPAGARPTRVDDLLRANKPELVTALSELRAEQPRVAALIRALRRVRSEHAPDGVTLGLNDDGRVVARPGRKAVPADRQAEVVALLAPLTTYLLVRRWLGPLEVGWRAETMGRTFLAGGAPRELPFLVARKVGEWDFARCFSCGDALANDPGWDGAAAYHERGFAEWLRCSDCREAVERVEAETGGHESRCFCGADVHRFTVGGDPLCEAHDQPVCLQCRKRPHTPGRWLLNAGGVERFRLCPYCETPAGHRVEVRGEERAA